MVETTKVLRELRTETVNHETGEVERTETISETMLPREPSFVKLYLRDLMYLRDLSPSLNVVMYELLNVMDYENKIYMNSGLKREIEKRCGLSFSTINNAITAFVKGKLLERMDTGVYRVNPFLFGKGPWSTVHRIRMEVTYTLGGKSIKTIINNGEEVQSDSEG